MIQVFTLGTTEGENEKRGHELIMMDMKKLLKIYYDKRRQEIRERLKGETMDVALSTLVNDKIIWKNEEGTTIDIEIMERVLRERRENNKKNGSKLYIIRKIIAEKIKAIKKVLLTIIELGYGKTS